MQHLVMVRKTKKQKYEFETIIKTHTLIVCLYLKWLISDSNLKFAEISVAKKTIYLFPIVDSNLGFWVLFSVLLSRINF
jgi:hypothetical protein